MTPEIKKMAVTPAIAQQWLEQNNNFRKLDERRAKRLATDMANGNWDVNGETVKFNCDGSLNDGQHRLRACVIADVPFETFVVWGVTDVNVDTGRPRAYHQILANRGYKRSDRLAAALRWVWRHEHNRMTSTGPEKEPTHKELDATLTRHPELPEFVEKAECASRVTSQATISFVAYMGYLTTGDRPKAEAFIYDVAKGSGLDENDPAHVLREKMLKNKASKYKMTTKEVMAITIKAWCYYRDERQVTGHAIRWRSVGPQKEPFPSFD